MAWSFRRRIKIAPGVHINLSKSGISTSIGPRGASITYGPKGTYLNIGIPGTGIYQRRKISDNKLDIKPKANLPNNNIKPPIKKTPDPDLNLSHSSNFGLWLFAIFSLIVGVYFLNVPDEYWDSPFLDENFKFGLAFLIISFVLAFFALIRTIYLRRNQVNILPSLEAAIVGIDERIKTLESKRNASHDQSVSALYQFLINKVSLEKKIFKTEASIINVVRQYGKHNKEGKSIIAKLTEDIESYRKELTTLSFEVKKNLNSYELDSYNDLLRKFEVLSNSNKVWKVSCDIHNYDTRSMRTPYSRQLVELYTGAISFITDIPNCPILEDNSSIKYYLYPKFIVALLNENEIDVMPISEFRLDYRTTNFIENEYDKPHDAKPSHYVYTYVNKDGSPDLRRTYNPKQPVYTYAEIRSSIKGVQYMVSNLASAADFVKAFKLLAGPQESREQINQNYNKNSIIDAIHQNKDDALLIEIASWVITLKAVRTSDLQRRFTIGFSRAGRIMDYLASHGIVGEMSRELNLKRPVLISTVTELDRILSASGFIKNTPDVRLSSKDSCQKQQKKNDFGGKTPMEALESLIGLSSVKDDIKTLSNFVKIQKAREKNGMKTTNVSYHCVFTGNPGTGKTTVARIVAAIYKELGVLKQGQLIETDRSGLVAEYIGQTAVKTNKIIDSAIDGVLFIDEAYSLIQGSKNDYGNEAIATLLKRMEDDRDRLIVILAGYSDEMKNFIDSNPGLQSRFNRNIHFPDYSERELYLIFKSHLDKYGYKITEEADEKLQAVICYAVKSKDENFGNGRFVRNLFEKTLTRQANRLSQNMNPTTEELSIIEASDISGLELD